ncbi:hypothetical protein WM27_09550 [Burkholderia ubonensis]|nr:hypothetical protein WM27_09550 [Burkholderia ubonensis]ODQ34546.1 hypothetical protein BGV65_12240 [Burkholderia ubonensis]
MKRFFVDFRSCLGFADEPKDACILYFSSEPEFFTKVLSKQLKHRIDLRASAGSVLPKVCNRCSDLLSGTQQLNVRDCGLEFQLLLLRHSVAIRCRFKTAICIKQKLNAQVSPFVLTITMNVELMRGEPSCYCDYGGH